MRITTTGLLLQYASNETAEKFSHDAAGWAMIVFAAACLGVFVLWLHWIIQAVEVETGRAMILQSRAAGSHPGSPA